MSIFVFLYAAMLISEKWKLCTGENSKEVEVQKNRIHRERETIYRTPHEIPLNPKEPWDREMDYDDTLTPQIPTEQLPDVDGVETMASLPENVENIAAAASSVPQNVNSSMPEPDLELLAVLLKNPELVFALTSGQAGNLSSEDTVKLLDMIKANGLKSTSNPNGLGRRAEDKVEVSLPSPTPSSNPGTVRDLTVFCTTFERVLLKFSKFSFPSLSSLSPHMCEM